RISDDRGEGDYQTRCVYSHVWDGPCFAKRSAEGLNGGSSCFLVILLVLIPSSSCVDGANSECGGAKRLLCYHFRATTNTSNRSGTPLVSQFCGSRQHRRHYEARLD